MKETLVIRPYKSSDFNEVMAIFDSNVPKFFDSSEREWFVNYLSDSLEAYFVCESAGKVIGAAGLNYDYPEAGNACFSWGMVHRNWHNQGVGTQLTKFRVDYLKQSKFKGTAVLRTSQHTYPFYEKMGFKTLEYKPDFWAPGLDLYHMVMEF